MTVGKAGFARGSLEGTFKPLLPWEPDDPLEGAVMYLEAHDQRLLLLSIDFGQFPRVHCTQVREGIGRKLDIPLDNIVFHATHNHSGPTAEDFVTHRYPLSGLTECLATLAREAMASAVPARCAFAAADVGTKFSICRRKWIHDDIANVTNWYAYQDDPARGALANHLIRGRLDRWFGLEFPDPEWLLEPIYYDNPVDSLVQILEFEDLRGNPLGGIIRFAAHPHLMNSAEPNGYSTDYCGQARRWLDRTRGGIHLFLEGPQCNLAPREHITFIHQPGRLNWADTPYGPDGAWVAADIDVLRNEVRAMGEGLALAGHRALESAHFQPLHELELVTSWHRLPMRGDVPADSTIAWEIRDEWGERIRSARKSGCSIIEMKRLTDQYNRFHWMRKMLDEWYLPSAQEIFDKSLQVHLQAVRINDVFLAGLPAETGLDTSLWLRAQTAGNGVITVQQCNGDIGYMIAAQDIRGGDYEAVCSLIADDGLPALHDGMLGLLREVGA